MSQPTPNKLVTLDDLINHCQQTTQAIDSALHTIEQFDIKTLSRTEQNTALYALNSVAKAAGCISDSKVAKRLKRKQVLYEFSVLFTAWMNNILKQQFRARLPAGVTLNPNAERFQLTKDMIVSAELSFDWDQNSNDQGEYTDVYSGDSLQITWDEEAFFAVMDLHVNYGGLDDDELEQVQQKLLKSVTDVLTIAFENADYYDFEACSLDIDELTCYVNYDGFTLEIAKILSEE